MKTSPNDSTCLATLRRLAWPLAFALSSALAGKSVVGETDSPAAALPTPPAAAAKPAERLREGSKLADVAGTFQFSGDRVAFSPDGSSDSLRVLENLALERVGRLLTEGRSARSWVVSGVITEFRGSNYLLLTKAVVKLEGDRPAGP
jgi:hypothetical protein